MFRTAFSVVVERLGLRLSFWKQPICFESDVGLRRGNTQWVKLEMGSVNNSDNGGLTAFSMRSFTTRIESLFYNVLEVLLRKCNVLLRCNICGVNKSYILNKNI